MDSIEDAKVVLTWHGQASSIKIDSKAKGKLVLVNLSGIFCQQTIANYVEMSRNLRYGWRKTNVTDLPK